MRENERGLRFSNIAHSDPNMSSNSVFPFDHDDFPTRCSSLVHASPNNDGYPSRMSGEGSPMTMSPWNQTTPYNNSDHSSRSRRFGGEKSPAKSLIGSLVREEGHIYSLAACGELLYTGSASKNIRVWKNLKEYSGFKSNSGLVKAIIISGQKIFTGHQDGKIRVWKINPKSPGVHKRAGTLPTLMDIVKSSVRPSNYVEIRGRRTGLWIKHSDAISCLCLSDDKTLLYSASWDRTVKVWRVEDYKCLESIRAHDDAVNAVVATAGGLVLSGSADGTVKVWRREVHGKAARHVFVQKLLEQESAVTALAADPSGSVVYCGSSDGLVSFWEREKQFSGGGVLKGHRLAVLCLAAAGNLAFSGSADKTVCVWLRDGMSHTCLTVLTGHAGPVKCLAVEPDGDSVHGDRRWVVYSGSLDKSVKVWSVSEFSPDFDQTAVMQRRRRYSESSPPSSSDDGSFSSEGHGGK